MGDLGGCGIDAVDVSRIDRLVERYGAAFWQRWFTAAEIVACIGAQRVGEQFAVCLAAKEAVVKSLAMDGRGPVPWRHVEVTDLPIGRPVVRLTGTPAETARRRGIGQISVAVSVGSGIAMAVAVGSVATGD